jgi:hypothetical protein
MEGQAAVALFHHQNLLRSSSQQPNPLLRRCYAIGEKEAHQAQRLRPYISLETPTFERLKVWTS